MSRQLLGLQAAMWRGWDRGVAQSISLGRDGSAWVFSVTGCVFGGVEDWRLPALGPLSYGWRVEGWRTQEPAFG